MTNRIDTGVAYHYGAIVGHNSGEVVNCYYDSLMCLVKGIDNLDIPGSAEGRLTYQMLGSNLFYLLRSPVPPYDDVWIFDSTLYPRPRMSMFGDQKDTLHPIDLLSAAPFWASTMHNADCCYDCWIKTFRKIDNLPSTFYVSN